MLFNSIHFLLFFPVVLIIYFILPHKIRYMWLLVSSYYFYMSWNPKYAILIATSTVITYLSGLLIDHSNNNTNEKNKILQKKLWVVFSLTSNLGILFFFKYFDFVIDNINYILSIANIQILQPSFDVLLPVGISFYTFQALSYTIDVYRGKIYAEKNIAKYALFVSFFPQLVAGPIERSKNLLAQISEKHYFNYERMKSGLLLMLWGFFQKLVIADRSAILVNTVYNNYNEFGSLPLIIATVVFAFQIFCDFAGYSNIAIGSAEILGFKLMENFKQPYFALSIKDFWRRWHISLSTWFKDYLYIPLGGNRCSKIKQYRNVMITFLISGLWHGASWNYIVWGGLHGAYQVVGDTTKKLRNKLLGFLHVDTFTFSHRLFQGLITFTLVDFAWIFFRASSTKVALQIIKEIFMFDDVFTGIETMGLDNKNLIALIIFIIIMLHIEHLRMEKSLRSELATQNIWFRWILYFGAISTVLIFGIYGPSYDASQFIYFEF